MPNIDYFLAKRPLKSGRMGFECGDDGIIEVFDGKVFIALIDALGHGGDAHAIAIICKNYLENNRTEDLVKTMEGLHKYTKSLNRGAVVCLCLLDIKTGELRYVGIGNICIRRFGSVKTQVVYKDGIVGYTIPTPEEEIMKLRRGDVLVLHTDGVTEHFGLEDYPKLLKDDAKKVAETILRRFGRKTDDACCIVLRYKG